jgi:hypothetical protein
MNQKFVRVATGRIPLRQRQRHLSDRREWPPLLLRMRVESRRAGAAATRPSAARAGQATSHARPRHQPRAARADADLTAFRDPTVIKVDDTAALGQWARRSIAVARASEDKK